MKKIFIILIFISLNVNAQEKPKEQNIKVINYCVKPEKPVDFATEAEYLMYQELVKTYTECSKKFIENETIIVEQHTKVLNEAIDEWNEFIKENQE